MPTAHLMSPEKIRITPATNLLPHYSTMTLSEKIRKFTAQHLSVLTPREREIIKLRYGLLDGFSYSITEIAEIFGISREAIRNIEIAAIRKLQQPKVKV